MACMHATAEWNCIQVDSIFSTTGCCCSIAEYGYPRGLDAYSVLPMYIRYVQASMHAPRLPKPRVFCSLFLSFGIWARCLVQ